MRLFVAIDATDELRERIREFQQRHTSSSFRFVRPETLHMTLKFLGEVREETLPKVKSALAAIEFSELKLETTKVGMFSGSVWLGVKLTSELAQLQREIELAMRPFALHDPRPFKPHFTIARFDLDAPTPSMLNGMLQGRIETAWKTRQFTLYRSTLTPAWPVYEPVAVFSSEKN